MHLVRRGEIIDRCRFDIVPLFAPKVPHKETAEIAQGKSAPSQPLLGFLRRDQVVIIAKPFRRRVDRVVVELEILFIGFLLGRKEPEQIFPLRLQFASKKSGIDHVAHGEGAVSANENDSDLDRCCFGIRHGD